MRNQIRSERRAAREIERVAAPLAAPQSEWTAPPGNGGSIAQHRFSEVSIGRPQAKLEVSQPSDPMEMEADRIAEMVVAPEASHPGGVMSQPGLELVQRKCTECKEEEEEQKRLASPKVQRKAAASVSDDIEDLASFDDATGTESRGTRALARSGSQPLDQSTRQFMESRMGYDFSKVRIHTDGEADRSARAFGAKAFALGPDVVLAAGQYSPDTREGKQLLAHELTHVVQQGHATSRASTTSSSQMQSSVGRGVMALAPGRQAVQGKVQRVPEWLNFSSDKCTSERWNCRAAWLTLAAVVVATLAAVATFTATSTLSAGLTLFLAAVAAFGGLLGVLASIAWGISAHKSLDACLAADPNADQAEKQEIKERLAKLEKLQKDVEDIKKKKEDEDKKQTEKATDAGAPPANQAPPPKPAYSDKDEVFTP